MFWISTPAPGIAAYKPLEVELIYNGVALDSLGVGYETFPAEVRTRVVGQFPRVNFKRKIAEAFLHGFEHKCQTTEYTCKQDICSHFIRNYKRSNFYAQGRGERRSARVYRTRLGDGAR